jgi:hypothetical protein
METLSQNNTTFTFMYCMMHDDGFIIQGNHDCVPEGYDMKHSTQCEVCDWCNMGVVEVKVKNNEVKNNKVKNNDITIIKTVRLNYDRYGGGFIFRLYIGTLTDDKGNSIHFDNEHNDDDDEDNCILYQWIDYINDTMTSEFLEA